MAQKDFAMLRFALAFVDACTDFAVEWLKRTGWFPSFQRYQNYWNRLAQIFSSSKNQVGGGQSHFGPPTFAGASRRTLKKRE